MASRPSVELSDIPKNPIKMFDIFYPSLAASGETHHWSFFADRCWHRGIEAALNCLPEDLRKAYEEALHASKDGFWKPDKQWAYWPTALKKSGLLDVTWPASASIIDKTAMESTVSRISVSKADPGQTVGTHDQIGFDQGPYKPVQRRYGVGPIYPLSRNGQRAHKAL